jgi:glycosyltransferase involved in cell wall biosynthesis
MTQTVTIGLPTYNRADRFLRPAIECALAQTWQDLEIIVSDNCSTDDTEEVVRSYDDPRLRYVRQPKNIGANNNFNFCVQEARGNYFLLFHDDDVLDPDMVESCMAVVGDDSDVGLIRTGTRLIDDAGALIREIPNRAGGLEYNDFFLAWTRDSVTSYVCSTLFNTRMLRRIGGFQSHHGLYQDLIAIAKLMAMGGHADIEAVKASVRRHEDNYGNSIALEAWCEDGRQLVDVLAAEAPDAAESIRGASMRYLSKTLYRKADRLVPDWTERIKAYRLIQRAFDDALTARQFVYQKTLGKPVARVRRFLRQRLRGTSGSRSLQAKG